MTQKTQNLFALFALLTLLTAVTGQAFAVLPPRYRRQAQEEADIHVRIDVQAVESVEQKPPDGRGGAYTVSRVTAVVTEVLWPDDLLEIDETITIEYTLRFSIAPGSNNPPRLEAGRSYPAFLDWNEQLEAFEPAAGADSFRELVEG